METTVASRVIYRGRVATLRVDDVRLPSGRTTRREIVEHPGAAAVVALTDAGEVVLVRQYRHAAGGVLLEIPAGTLEPGEAAVDCAHRELAEEAGLRAEGMTPLVTFLPSPGILTEAITIYQARGLSPVAAGPDAGPDAASTATPAAEEEGLHAVRVPLHDIPALIASGEIRDAKSLIGLLILLRAAEPTRGL